MIKLAVFDLDGTVLDTLGDLHAAVNAAMRAGGFPEHSSSQVKAMIGDGVAKLIQRALPEDKSDCVDDALSVFREYYESHICEYTCPFPGIVEVLNNFKSAGIRLAVLTNKPDSAAKIIIGKLLPGVFCEVEGGRKGIRLKPYPDQLISLLEKTGVSAEDACMIGDSGNDMLTAKAAGVRGIGVEWGYRDRDELIACGACCTVRDARELEKAVLNK